MRAIWRCWERGEKLDYRGKHYSLTLMTPDFSPQRTGLPMVPVTLAAVGPAMLRLAGELCDGVRLHPICSRRYLEEACLPAMCEGMKRSGRSREHFDIHGGGFVCTGPDEAAVRKAMEAARFRVAFYGSTRTYLPILAMHGLEELGHKLHEMSVQGKWSEMARQVSDDTLRLFAACGTYGEIAGEIERRFGGAADSITIPLPPGWEAEPVGEMLEEIHRIPHAFRGFKTEG